MQELTKKDILISEKNKILAEIVKHEIDINILEKENTELVVAKDILAKDKEGKTLSTRDVRVSEMKERYEKGNEGFIKRLKAIEEMIKKEK